MGMQIAKMSGRERREGGRRRWIHTKEAMNTQEFMAISRDRRRPRRRGRRRGRREEMFKSFVAKQMIALEVVNGEQDERKRE
jgi:hypothetical protein